MQNGLATLENSLAISYHNIHLPLWPNNPNPSYISKTNENLNSQKTYMQMLIAVSFIINPKPETTQIDVFQLETG